MTRIEIGYALRGGRFVRETIAAAPPTTTTRPGERPAPTSRPVTASVAPAPETRPAPSEGSEKTSDVSDIEKRMRQRRERELRK